MIWGAKSRRARRTGVLLFFATGVVLAQAPSRPSPVPDDIEMGRSNVRVPVKVDPVLRAKFEADYRAQPASRAVYEKYLPLLGPVPILDFLEAQSNGACHGDAHDLGRALFALRKDVGGALRECGTRCTSACMHGVVGEAFGKTDARSIVSAMNGFCATGAMAELHKPGNCAHGIGHALMFTSGDDVSGSLNACLYFATPAMRYYCGTGVFMEFMPKRKPTRLSELHSPCDQYPGFAAACYRYRAPLMLAELDGDFDKLIRECQSLQGASRLGCAHGMGATAGGFLRSRPELLARVCGRGTADEQVVCIEGAIEKLADFDEKKATPLCATLGGKNKDVCLAAAREKMYRLDKPSMPLYQDPALVATRKPLVNAR